VKTTEIYADYVPSKQEGEMVELAFSRSDQAETTSSRFGVRRDSASGASS
jgi:hypothetical protein